MPSLQMFCWKICCPFSCMSVFHHITFVCFLLQQAKAAAFVMSCHACIFFNHVLFAQPACRFCLFWVTSVFSLFFSCLRSLILLAAPAFILWQPIRAQERMDTPLIFTPAPSRGRLHEDTVYWRLCQNKNPQRGRRSAGRELCLGVYTALYSVHLHTFYFSSPIWVWTWLHILTSWNFQVKKAHFPFLRGRKIMKYSILNCSKVQ